LKSRSTAAAPVRDDPHAWQDDEGERIDEDRVGQREEALGADAEDERRDGDERVRRVEVAAEQEPGDDRPEPPPAEAPLVELAQVAAPPARRDEAHDRDHAEEQTEDDEGDGGLVRHLA
jgi:hypothetical protein